MTFGQALRKWRGERSLRQAASELDCSPPQLSAWEDDHSEPTRKWYSTFVRVMEVDLATLMELLDESAEVRSARRRTLASLARAS